MIRRVAPLPLAMFSCVREEQDSKYRTNKQNEFTLGTANTGGGEALRSTLVINAGTVSYLPPSMKTASRR